MELQSNTPPDIPNGSGAPGGESGGNSNSTNVTHTGATTFISDTEVVDTSYNSSIGSENAVLISGGNVTFDSITVTKTGDDSGDSSDFYGTNAALFAYNDASVTIINSSFSTDGSHANAVFAYGSATIDISDSAITTSSNNSGGIMATGGGTINATNLDIATSGNSSAAIRSDRGGGTINVSGGVYNTNGVGSPVIYSTADISVSSAKLTSMASEGIVIEGKNSVALDGVTLTATNNKLNGQSETYKTIFIYQSMSGDASEGTGTFAAENSLITTNKGDHFFVTNTNAVINLTGNKFVQNDETGGFLRAQTSAWGNTGSNGGKVTLNATDQEINGDIVIDSISMLDMKMQHSYFKGAFTGEGTVNLTLDTDSIIVLTSDSYVSSLTNADSSNSNIYANGHKFYVGGSEVVVNEEEAPESFLAFDEESLTTSATTEVITTGPSQNSTNNGFPIWGYFVIGGIVAIVVILGGILAVRFRKRKNDTRPLATPSNVPAGPANPAAPMLEVSPDSSETPVFGPGIDNNTPRA